MSIPTITARELADRSRLGSVVLIDVRTPAEFEEVHVAFARNVPLDRLRPAELTDAASAETLYVICKSGSRGRQAAERCQAAGLLNVINVEGGTTACIEAGLPVVRGRKTMSLQRQVQIAAGSLTLLGAVLAMTVHPWFASLSALTGAGLIFSGITDTCAMAAMLARMPWNRRPARPACSASP